MHWLSLPEPSRKIEPAFHDPASAREWLARQPQTLALYMLGALHSQIEAIDAAALPPATTIQLLGLLRSATVPVQASVEARFFRKPLPLPEEDQRCSELAQQLWTSLGIAYLRRIPHLLPVDRSLPLNRAACAFRMAEYCHFQASRQCPTQLDQLLFAILAEASRYELLRQAVSDPDFPHLGEANIAGHLAWAFMLRLIDPYRLTATELIVANRAVSRWRELTSFQNEPDEDKKSRTVDLQPLFGSNFPEGLPRWLNLRTVHRKIQQRIASLKAGESPESLKLGRELSASACIRLLNELESSLNSPPHIPDGESGQIELFFGGDNAFAIFNGELLNPLGKLDTTSASLAHERVAMFGFDQAAHVPTAVKKLSLPSETWSIEKGMAVRPSALDNIRRMSPCLIAMRQEQTPRLGVLFGLQTTSEGALTGGLHWYEEEVEAGWLKRLGPPNQRAPRVAAFLLEHDAALSVILPVNAGVRLETGLALEGTSVAHVVPFEVLERGVDYVRYACRRG